jgi:hypothetical protein
MASSVAVAYAATCTVVETLDATANPDIPLAKRVLTHSDWNTVKTLNGASSPPATLVASFAAALSGGVLTLDLTALVGTNGIAVDGTGLRVQVLRLKNSATNGNPISVAKGSSNGYDGLGAAFKITLAPGAEALVFGNDAGSDIGGTNKTLDLAGTLVQALDVEIVIG